MDNLHNAEPFALCTALQRWCLAVQNPKPLVTSFVAEAVLYTPGSITILYYWLIFSWLKSF